MSNSLNELEIYSEAMRLGELVWNYVLKWDYLGKDAVGKQFVRFTDSIAANISESHGRFHFKDDRKFCHFSRVSIAETQTLLQIATFRKLIDDAQAREIHRDLKTLKKRLNAYIKSIGSTSENS